MNGDRVALLLGDNLFFGDELSTTLQEIARDSTGATIFAHTVRDPKRYWVVEFDAEGRAVSIEEKPATPRTTFAVLGCTSTIGM